MKKLLLSAACGAAMIAGLAAPAAAQDEPAGVTFSGTLGVTSNYVFRGQSQSQNDPAISLGARLDYEGFYFGLWGSSIDFADVQESPLELDIYAGYAGSLSDTLSFDVGLFYYSYPDSDPANYDYFELIVGLRQDFDGGYVKGTLAISPDFFAESGTGTYLGGGGGVAITDWLEANANIGYQWIDENGTFGTPDYFHWDVGLTATLDILTLDLRYKDTDLETFECFGGTDLCDGRIYGGATINF